MSEQYNGVIGGDECCRQNLKGGEEKDLLAERSQCCDALIETTNGFGAPTTPYCTKCHILEPFFKTVKVTNKSGWELELKEKWPSMIAHKETQDMVFISPRDSLFDFIRDTLATQRSKDLVEIIKRIESHNDYMTPYISLETSIRIVSSVLTKPHEN